MDRRSFLVALPAGLSAGTVVMGQEHVPVRESDPDTTHDSTSLLLEFQRSDLPNYTEIYLIEYGDADYAIIETFYYTQHEGRRLLLHKESATPLAKGTTVGTGVDLAFEDIVFTRIRRLRLLETMQVPKEIPKE